MAQMAEALGLDSFCVFDHMLYRYPDLELGCWEAFTFLGALAASTSTIRLGPLVACTAFRNPGLLAKMAISLDEISGGRFFLGLGAGWHAPEFAAFGYPFDHRAARFAEAVQIIAPLVRTGRATFRGQYHWTDAVVRLRGPSLAGLPIWIGAKGPRMLRLVALHADAWNTDWVQDPARIAELRHRIGDACTEVGRDPATLALTAMCEICILKPNEAPTLTSSAITGTPNEIAVVLQRFAQAGVDHLVLFVKPSGVVGLERLERVLQTLGDRNVTR
jgi:alkanesulfonate monooxygenase SsuD/methylene tetrahydromethanopterin reductase-like flavin-dependent oxidoreductase (luciferase family)